VSDSSTEAANINANPEEKAKMGHRVDFKATLRKPNHKLQILHGEVSGGLEDGKTLACRRKQWLDKIKLMIMMRDELNQLVRAYKNADSQDLVKVVVYGAQVIGLRINIYAMIWCGGRVYLFGLVDSCVLPTVVESAYNLEQAFVIFETLKLKIRSSSVDVMAIERFVARKRRRTALEDPLIEEALECARGQGSTEDVLDVVT